MHHFHKTILINELEPIIDLFSETEKVIISSLITKEGIFYQDKYKILGLIQNNTVNVLILINKSAFILGNKPIDPTRIPSEIVNQLDQSTILGSKKIIEPLFHKDSAHLLLKKNFAFLTKEIIAIDKPNLIIDINNPSSQNITDFAKMKSEFLLEERSKKTSWQKLIISEQEYSNLAPAILKINQTSIGMISSNFHSAEYAMINMIYIRPQYRQQQYGKYLLTNYINYLLKQSKKICLFYSPDNISAKKLYLNSKFQDQEEWIMAIPI